LPTVTSIAPQPNMTTTDTNCRNTCLRLTNLMKIPNFDLFALVRPIMMLDLLFCMRVYVHLFAIGNTSKQIIDNNVKVVKIN